MLKTLLSTGLLLALMTALIGPVVITGWFYANQAVLAEKYCENKALPALNCDGSCYLAKKLRQASLQATAPAPAETVAPAPPVLPLFWEALSAPQLNVNEPAAFAPFRERCCPRLALSEVFHPPRA